MPPKLTYFTDDEVEGLRDEFCAKLDLARKAAEVPFVITSGFRTPQANQSIVGSVSDSAHCAGLAVDLLVTEDTALFKIVMGALSSGIHRIGIYFGEGNQPKPTHVHLDDDTTKPPEVIWLKREATANSAPASA
jgi:uncharacterized protein YcbK (DUF882 family)